MLDKSDVVAAAKRIRALHWRTPALRCDALDSAAGAELWLKAENLQRIGAFKARGAMHAVARLAPQERARGIITYSSGNHAQAVALAAHHFGIRADIAMPENAPAVKVEAVRALGAHIVFAGTTSLERQAEALRMQERSGGTIIEPFDHPDIITGQGTATLELLEDAGSLDALVVPVGGGGLLAGACLAASGSGTRIYTAEPEGCDAMKQSLQRGERITIEPTATIADGLRPSQVGSLCLAIAREHVTDSFVVTDAQLRHAMRLLAIRAKLIVEPSGAAALAVALRGLPDAPGRVGILLSGGNVAPSLLAEILAG